MRIVMPFPWGPLVAEPAPLRGTRVWRATFHDRPSFTFGLWVGEDEAAALKHASQWGDVLSVETVT